MRRSTGLALAGAVLMSVLAAPAAATASPPGRIAADPIAHDPTLIRAGRYYYDIITGDTGTHTYLPVRRSTDLLHWTLLGPVFTVPPAWVVAELGRTPGDFWAPDISFSHGEYRLYYAASSFGTNNSVIGLATNRTLDPASPDYRWVDRGMVIRSRTTDNFNAIDPEVAVDAAGVPWLAFGSFWDGIKMRRLDPVTGGLSTMDETLYSLASRGGASIEAPSIVRHGRYFYLFASLDFCCRGVNSDYRTVVGRSASITGPYVDAAGVPMLAGGGTEVLRGYNEFRGTGGGDVYGDLHGDLFAHHYYDLYDSGAPKLSVRRIRWVGGWPRLGDPLSGSRMVGRGPAYVRIVNRDSGAAVANIGCGYEGADIRLAAPAGDPCQQWRLDDRADGYASVGNRFSNKVAEVAACVNTDGARVAQWGWLANDCQRFRVVGTGGGWSRIENKLAGRVLTPAGCGGAGAAIQAATWTGATCQQFRLDPVGEVLIADAAGQRVLDGCARPRLAPRRGTACQGWHFQPTADGFYRIVNTRTGRALRTRAPGGGTEWRIAALNDGTDNLVDRTGAVLDLGGQAVRLLIP
jgi:hypothetical protein